MLKLQSGLNVNTGSMANQTLMHAVLQLPSCGCATLSSNCTRTKYCTSDYPYQSSAAWAARQLKTSRVRYRYPKQFVKLQLLKAHCCAPACVLLPPPPRAFYLFSHFPDETSHPMHLSLRKSVMQLQVLLLCSSTDPMLMASPSQVLACDAITSLT